MLCGVITHFHNCYNKLEAKLKMLHKIQCMLHLDSWLPSQSSVILSFMNTQIGKIWILHGFNSSCSPALFHFLPLLSSPLFSLFPPLGLFVLPPLPGVFLHGSCVPLSRELLKPLIRSYSGTESHTFWYIHVYASIDTCVTHWNMDSHNNLIHTQI